LALESDPTWQVDPYMSSTPTFIDNFIVLENLRKRVNEQLSGEVEIFWVMGTDNYYYGMDPEFLIKNNISLFVVENRDS
jgi:nicotinic acid mononucleotide adenylyltransferase